MSSTTQILLVCCKVECKVFTMRVLLKHFAMLLASTAIVSLEFSNVVVSSWLIFGHNSLFVCVCMFLMLNEICIGFMC